MALKLDILANTRQLQSEMKKAGASVEDITDALDDVAREGDRSTEKMESSFKELSRQAKKTEADVKDVGKKGFSAAGGASGEFKDETLSNLSEVTSSFDGSMESIGELVQGTLGGVAATTIPGIGLAAGAVAVGVGGITARFTELGEESKRIKDQIISDALETGDALDKEAVDSRVRDILGTETTMKQAQLLKDILGVNLGEAALILAGDFESAGVRVEDVMAGIENASGDINFDTWNDLKNTIGATTSALQGAEQAAKAQNDAVALTAKNATTEQKKLNDEAGKTASLLSGGYTPRVNIGPAMSELSRLQRKAAEGITLNFRSTGGQLLG